MNDMKKKCIKQLKNTLITILVLAFIFGVSVVFQSVLNIDEHVTTVFVFGVFVISLVTDGYVYGLISALISTVAVNFAFTFPYFAFNFTIPENFLSALFLVVISFLTSALTTKLKKWQRLRAESEMESMRANLLRAVSHDLRTPLTAIYGASSAMLENQDALTTQQQKKMIKGIKEDTEWLIRMVENLLSVTRLDGKDINLIKAPTPLEELIDAVLLKFKKRYPDQSVEIDIPEEMILVSIDAILIEQVIINILENAVQHAIGMTRLCFRVYVNEDKVIFEISDDGCGIEAIHLKNIFTGYYNGTEQPAVSDKRTSGIGLSVCATIIKAHGGTIFAQNAEGGGAVFVFILDKEDGVENE